ncbi:hypothetical protein ANTRET_LOCUS51 [Anthophora retusa]
MRLLNSKAKEKQPVYINITRLIGIGIKENVFRRVLIVYATAIILETPMYEPEPAINFVIVCVPIWQTLLN